jgi:hypothetical protein
MLEGEEPAQELMLSGQLLQQLTVLRGRNVGEFVLAFLIVEVADDDQLGGVFGAALAYLAMGTDGDLPGLPSDAGDRVLLRLPRSQPTSR